MVSTDLGIDDVRAAARLLDGVAQRTPIHASRALTELVGVPVHLKCENLQRTGSFKIRGAYVRMARLSAAEKARGVVAASAGNHAQGVALAADLLGLSATVYMPVDAALPKIAATRGYGATVHLVGETLEEALDAARAAAESTGATLIHPFDHRDIVLGQATVGLEIVEQLPDVATIVVPVGGGGLAAGIALAATSVRPGIRVIGVQAERAAAYPRSLAEHHPVHAGELVTMADGIAVGLPGDVPFAIIRDRCAGVVTVSEEDLSRALLLLAERSKLIVEPAGAAGVAALMSRPQDWEGPVVAVLSGGNIDPNVLFRVLRHGLASAGRYLQLRVRLSDRPGSLALLMARLAQSGANVMHVGHVRTGVGLAIDEVEIDVQAETKGPEHAAQVLEDLRAGGFQILEA